MKKKLEQLSFTCAQCHETGKGDAFALALFQKEHLEKHKETESTEAEVAQDPETINHPSHYNSHPSGIECIEVVEHMNFNVGNAIKYLWRAGSKGDPMEDLKKAAWYINREIDRLDNG